MNESEKLSDEEIVEKVRTSDQSLYALLIERYQKKLMRYAFGLTKDEQKAIDIVQESFIKAFINLQSFDLEKKFSSWIYRIAHNQMLNVLKREKKEILLEDDWDFRSEENLEDNFGKKEIAEMVRKCLGEMPILYSEPLSLYYIDEKSYEEISDILRIPMGTVATRISRAKKIIKKICQKK
ncbi:MAG: RNA polymerase sigma factor [Candidatus Pacebacteria bacterium]|nr:RNA polymerase sigma factor [Candidatus Paceibacterota bacterium]MCF7862590.1 RNA polymerase sigma factor [Candidatus Paceibacterota bacterium]